MPAKRFNILLMLPVAVLFLGATLSAAQEVKPFDRRIVGGLPTKIEDHQWQVELKIVIQGQTIYCGGSLIDDRWVLTAAHCFEPPFILPPKKPSEVKVKTGVTNFQTEGEWSDVAHFVIHEAYAPQTVENDLALVELRSRPRGQEARAIPLAQRGEVIPVGQSLEVTGYGYTSERGSSSGQLLKANVPYVDNNVCNEPAAYNGTIKPGMMCAGYREGDVDSCQGDSGGPLVWQTINGPLLVGVVSWGEGCARRLRYGVYTRVSSYRDWIGRVTARGGN